MDSDQQISEIKDWLLGVLGRKELARFSYRYLHVLWKIESVYLNCVENCILICPIVLLNTICYFLYLG
jgi:hypothetical protein